MKGCGCNKGKAIKMEAKNGTASYEDPLACGRCYAKHLAKALVLWQEYREDNARLAELSLCLGNIGCAEDHAAALGREADRRKLREIRTHVWDADFVVARELQEAAASAVKLAVQAEAARRAQAAREAVVAKPAAEAEAKNTP